MNAASTSYSANLVRYLNENVVVVKEDPGDDHWLVKVPSSVVTVLKIDVPST